MYSFNEIKNLLIEESNVEKVEGNDSIDLQIDRLLGEFESDSIINEDKQEVKQSKKTNLDVQQFALYISQLIDNVENLIEFKNTIMRRTINHLNKTFNKVVAHEFEIIMEDEYGIVIGKSQNDLNDEIKQSVDTHAIHEE